MEQLKLNTFLNKSHYLPVVDVRSLKEYEEGHIPGSISMPLFSNSERVEVGTLYKNVGKRAAIKLGLKFVGPKMTGFVEFAETLESDEILVHCWRGGMRSANVAWLLNLYGFKAYTLQGGYKSYRSALLAFFQQSLPLNVLTGYTGSMKTEILIALKEMGSQVIDLEGLAGHQGSSFGKELSEGQPTTEHFQNLLFEEFKKLDLNRRIWIEDESASIGRVFLPEGLYHQMGKSPHFLLLVPRVYRISHLVKNYGRIETHRLIESTRRIEKRLGHKETEEAISHISNGRLAQAADIILTYYDRSYKKLMEKKNKFLEDRLEAKSNDPMEIARMLKEIVTHERI